MEKDLIGSKGIKAGNIAKGLGETPSYLQFKEMVGESELEKKYTSFLNFREVNQSKFDYRYKIRKMPSFKELKLNIERNYLTAKIGVSDFNNLIFFDFVQFLRDEGYFGSKEEGNNLEGGEKVELLGDSVEIESQKGKNGAEETKRSELGGSEVEQENVAVRESEGEQKKQGNIKMNFAEQLALYATRMIITKKKQEASLVKRATSIPKNNYVNTKYFHFVAQKFRDKLLLPEILIQKKNFKHSYNNLDNKKICSNIMYYASL